MTIRDISTNMVICTAPSAVYSLSSYTWHARPPVTLEPQWWIDHPISPRATRTPQCGDGCSRNVRIIESLLPLAGGIELRASGWCIYSYWGWWYHVALAVSSSWTPDCGSERSFGHGVHHRRYNPGQCEVHVSLWSRVFQPLGVNACEFYYIWHFGCKLEAITMSLLQHVMSLPCGAQMQRCNE
jgi:hypothetical protein